MYWCPCLSRSVKSHTSCILPTEDLDSSWSSPSHLDNTLNKKWTNNLPHTTWKLASHHLSMMPEYNERICVTIFKHKQTSRFFLEWYTQLCTLHTLNVSVRIPAFHMSMWLEKLLLQAYYLQLVADILPFRSWSAPDLWPTSLRWLNRYALP